MAGAPEGFLKFGSYFLIWNLGETGHLPGIFVGVGDFFVGEVAEVDEEGQHVVFALEGFYVVLEGVGVDFDAFVGDEADDIVLEAVLVHVDVGHERFRGGGFLPVGAETFFCQGLHDGIRIVDGGAGTDGIAIVPGFHAFKISTVFFTFF